MKFNINHDIKLKLTSIGIKIWESQYDEFNLQYPHMKLPRPVYSEKCDENGYIKMQLWVAMEMFGEHVGMCSDLPFETDIIIGDE